MTDTRIYYQGGTAFGAPHARPAMPLDARAAQEIEAMRRDLDDERNRHQVTALELETARAEVADLRRRNLELSSTMTDLACALASAHRRALETALEHSALAITGRPMAAVSAEMEAQLAAYPCPEIPPADPEAFADPEVPTVARSVIHARHLHPVEDDDTIVVDPEGGPL